MSLKTGGWTRGPVPNCLTIKGTEPSLSPTLNKVPPCPSLDAPSAHHSECKTRGAALWEPQGAFSYGMRCPPSQGPSQAGTVPFTDEGPGARVSLMDVFTVVYQHSLDSDPAPSLLHVCRGTSSLKLSLTSRALPRASGRWSLGTEAKWLWLLHVW